MRPFIWWIALVVSMLTAPMAMVACTGEDRECSGDSDCPGDQICRSNTCVDPGGAEEVTCHEDVDCQPPQVCDRTTGRCKAPEDYDGGVHDRDSGHQGGQDSGGQDSGQRPDVPDHDPPEVVRTVPAADSRGVPVDQPIQVVFSEPVNEFNVQAGISLYDTMDPDAERINATVSWDPDTLTATLTPQVHLKPYTTYKLVVREEIRDLHGNFLEDFPDIFFTTDVDHEAEEFYGELAKRYAPHVFQETSNENVWADWLAAYDFDDSWSSERKFRQWQVKKELLAGVVYWSVIETKTHYFVSYVLYHPFDYTPGHIDSPIAINTMTGATVVLAKRGDHEEWLAMETYVDDDMWAATIEGAPISARPETDGGIGRFTAVMPSDWLVDGTHFQMFVPHGLHNACIWGHESTMLEVLNCPTSGPAAFYHNGLHYIPGDGPDGEVPMADVQPCDGGCPNPGEACVSDECTPFHYGFRSLAGELWVRIHEYESKGEDIWTTPFVYSPSPDDARRPGAGLTLPSKFKGDPAGGIPPWAWQSRPKELPRGQWFMDPAFVFHRHLQPAEGDDWAVSPNDYCWNVYLGIFARTAPGCSGHE